MENELFLSKRSVFWKIANDMVPRVLYYPCIEQTAEVFAIYDNSPVITATANRSSELAPSLWHGSSSPTVTDTLTVVLTLKYTLRVTISMRKIVGGVVRYRDLVAKIKIAKIFFLACLLVICENFPLYGIFRPPGSET